MNRTILNALKCAAVVMTLCTAAIAPQALAQNYPPRCGQDSADQLLYRRAFEVVGSARGGQFCHSRSSEARGVDNVRSQRCLGVSARRIAGNSCAEVARFHRRDSVVSRQCGHA